MCHLAKPIPSMHRIIPAIYAFWNSVKGGSDTTTKLMDDCLIQVPKCHMNTETVAISRCLLLVIVLFHRLSQIQSSSSNIDDYPSLHHFRNAASCRSTFHQTILKCARIFGVSLMQKNDAQRMDELNNTHHYVTPPQRRRRNPSRQLFGGVLPEEINFGSTLSTVTPKRLGHLIRTNQASLEIQNMVSTCSGIPMQAFLPTALHRCDFCIEKKTSWYCVGCKRWLCMTRRNTAENSKELKLYSHKVKERRVQFNKSCFHEAHQDNWQFSPHD
jgi:hypothetical protein